MVVEVIVRKTTFGGLLLIWTTVAVAGCNPEAGMWTPKNPGSVRAFVQEQSGAPVSGAMVMVEIPNSVGSVFRTGSQTSGNGTVTIHGVPEGERPVYVTPPGGYGIDAAERVKVVDVRRSRTTSVTFVLTRMESTGGGD
jgi:hypothetical protein